MATGFPVKANYATGDVLTAANMNDLSGTLNYLQYTANGLLAGKNGVINGGFDIWQRGTSSSTNANYGSADRWWLYYAAGTCTVSQETSIVPTGLRYAAKLTQSVASTSNLQWNQAIETANAVQFAGQTVTLSGYVAASASTNIYITLNYSTSTDVANSGSWTSLTPTSGSNTVTVGTTTYVRVSAQYAVPSTAKSLQVQMGTSSIASGTSIYFSGIQLELGSAVSTFARAGGTIQGELAACQRYYYRATAAQNFSQVSNLGTAGSTVSCLVIPTIKVTLRATPTVVDYSGLALSPDNANSTVTVTSATISVASPDNPQIALGVASGLTQYRPYYAIAPTAGGYLGIGAEL